jgi:hypothetical protein
MPRRLTATIGLVLVLAIAGCGNDDGSGTPAGSAATVTQPGDAASKSSKASRTSTGSRTSSASRTASTSSRSKTGSGSKQGAGPTSSATVSSKTAAGSRFDPPSGADPRIAVVATVRRYQKDFIEGDGNDACFLLTATGRRQMTTAGRGRTCAQSVKRVLDQARASDISLIRQTRAAIHVADVTIRGDGATVSIGQGARLRLARQAGRWLVDDPSP